MSEYVNRKPYRTKAQKAIAKRTAYKGKDGAFHSTAPVSYHDVALELIERNMERRK